MNDVDLGSELEARAGGVDTTGVVSVLAFLGYRRRQARCSCGWRGPVRWLLPKGAAVDALTHAAGRGCAPAYPLVSRVEGVR
ncbi:hypothetical protein [Mycolicibacterium palauense]|uniref:hypothetical protein n=1 Tax=Mycolicibacterium palauense TaxID=2034511 RepID=UPI0011456DB3|nr:hypothetical protein [Mycolicibacterium palauense]